MLVCRWMWPSFCVFLFILVLEIPVSGMAESFCSEWVGRMVSLQGNVEVRRVGESDWEAVSLEDTFCFGDTIRVMEDGRAAVQLQNDALLRLDQKTTLTFSDIQNERTYIIDLLKGAVHFFSRGSRSLKVVTPYVNAAVEGTEFEVRVTDDEAKVTLMEGQVLLENDQGEVNLAKGEVGVARAGTAPTSYVTVSPRDAVKWALYYPRVVQAPSEDAPALSGALRLVYQAEEKLSLGQVDAAEEDIDAALFLDPENGDAFSLKAVIAVVNNQRDEAQSLAEKAVASAPKAASARLALSYARQAAFDLEGALAALETAVELEPDNALAWARLSELRLSLENADGAFLAAQRATSLQPDLSHIQSILGYAYLAQVKLDAAQEAFEIAISLDSSAPLPQLGLGLTKIRRGDLVEGRRLIEVAAGLDPGNSVFRSYLGKAYFEEKRDKFSADQFAIAKELDPNDPTPWLYDAVRKQSINRPVEALKDLQKSIELNDNRGVYRSSLHLDEDLAIRGTGLARIYSDLGFQQLALVEGWKSVNSDPGNYAAHRFLADSYATTSRHEIARFSEMLQAQLLQPINISPISPLLAQGDLSIFRGSGPAESGYNEYMTLFDRNGLSLQMSGAYGGNGILGDELIQSGVWGNFSYSLGQYHYETNGVRENNDQETNIYNVFIQMHPWQNVSLMAEYQSSERDYGDLPLRFDIENDYYPDRQEEDIESFRTGFHYSPSASADTIGTFVTKKVDSNYSNSGTSMNGNDSGWLFEIQQQYRTDFINIVGGTGYFNSDMEIITISGLYENEANIDTKYTNAYFYANLNFPEPLIWTTGCSFDYFDGRMVENEKQFNPKLGITWQISSTTVLRAAAFRTLNRTLISNQTIEPTQVSGFSQFFNDVEGVDVERYGAAIDQRISPDLYSGVEYSERYLVVPYLSMVMEEEKADWKEKAGRGYLFWTPLDSLSISSEYQWKRFDRDIENTGVEMIETLDTRQVSLGISYFHPGGMTFKAKTNYVDQSGDFAKFDFTSPSFFSADKDSDSFWVADIIINYRLPKRMGLFSFQILNVFNESFKYLEIDSANPEIYPERLLLTKISMSF